MSDTMIAGGLMAKKRATIHVPTTEAEAIARVTAIVSAEEKAGISLLCGAQQNETGLRITESNYVRSLIKKDIERAIKERQIAKSAVDAEAKTIRSNIKLRKPK
jgi:hypothetical protein